MKLNFIQLEINDRSLHFEQAALRRGLSPIIIEKDFWVSWMLGVLFRSEFSDSLVFKGGTSLSKVFRAIDRFSEDIDLSLSPSFLGITESEVEAASSRNKRQHWMERMQDACSEKVRDTIRPAMEQLVVEAMGQRTDGQSWFQFRMDEMTNSPVLLFHYPTTQEKGYEYLPRSVKLEFGSLTDQQPKGRHPISPWVAEVFPDAFGDWKCEVIALEIERSFWEKATILHALYHRSAESKIPDRFSRHYADTAALASHSVASTALANHELRNRVVSWKSRFFASASARYDLAVPGTFRLVPPDERVPELKKDYREMSAMYLSEPKDFDEILGILVELERHINAEGDLKSVN